MIQIAICEDNLVYAKNISEKIARYFWKKEIDINISIFSTYSELSSINLKNFDLFFLDIELGEFSGIDIGVDVKNSNPAATIIYISAFYTYAISGYKARPIAYILKSDNQFENSLYNSLDEYVQEKLTPKETITLKNRDDEKTVFLDDIVYIESFGRKLSIHFINDNTFEIYGKISDMENKLSNKGFLRIHKSYIINMKFLEKISNYQAYLSTNQVFPTSESKYSHIITTYALWKGKN